MEKVNLVKVGNAIVEVIGRDVATDPRFHCRFADGSCRDIEASKIKGGARAGHAAYERYRAQARYEKRARDIARLELMLMAVVDERRRSTLLYQIEELRKQEP